jgi:hypothetical protein
MDTTIRLPANRHTGENKELARCGRHLLDDRVDPTGGRPLAKYDQMEATLSEELYEG